MGLLPYHEEEELKVFLRIYKLYRQTLDMELVHSKGIYSLEKNPERLVEERKSYEYSKCTNSTICVWQYHHFIEKAPELLTLHEGRFFAIFDKLLHLSISGERNGYERDYPGL